MKQGKKLFRLCAFAFAVTGIVLCMIHCPRYWELFSYFTIQSNVMCLLMMGINLRRESPAPLRGIATVCITLTFLVFHFMLRPADLTLDNLGNISNMSTLFAHYIVPFCVWVDYILFSPKGHMRLYYPVTWLCYPLLYLAYILLVYKPLGGTFLVEGQLCRVPYFFLDAEALGAGGVAVWCIIIAAGFLTLAYLFVLIDKLLSD